MDAAAILVQNPLFSVWNVWGHGPSTTCHQFGVGSAVSCGIQRTAAIVGDRFFWVFNIYTLGSWAASTEVMW